MCVGGGYIHAFNNRKEWEDFLLNEDISFSAGLRFHGNMMAFSCGIPALWIVSDRRMQEMVEAMKLPHIYKHELDNITTPDTLLKLADYNEEFMKYYKQMGEAYVQFLGKNRVEHNFEKINFSRKETSERL